MKPAPFLLALLAATGLCGAPRLALAQQTAKVVTTCGTQTYTNGTFNYPTVDTLGNWCGNNGGGGSGTITGPLGRQADAASVSSALSTEDYAAITAPIPAGTNAIGSLNAATYGSSTALASNKVLKGSAGTLYALDVVADSTLYASTWYVMIYDATSLPGDGAVTPAKCYAVPANSPTFSAGWPSGGVAMLTGITVGVSTTGCFTQTASIHAMISGDFK